MNLQPLVTMDTVAESTTDPQLAATLESQSRHQGLVHDRGALIGRYLVLGHLGAGAMGVVYAAHDPELDRKIALKLLKPGLGGPDARARLLREAQSMARLAHPNVVTVHDVGTFGNEVFIAMEFIQGVTLTRWLADKAREWRDIVAIFVAAGRGLIAAHNVGLIHRDLKPDNIMVGDDGRVRVMDFGIARADSIDPRGAADAAVTRTLTQQHLTRTGAWMGTPAYMAPEQWNSGTTDAHADQFSFCVALWEALYDERPFVGDSWGSLMLAVTSGQRTEPRDPKRVPLWLRRVLERGLLPAPTARWLSMDALLRELTRDRLARVRRWLIFGAGLLTVVAGGLGVQQVLEKRAAAAAERERADAAESETRAALGRAEREAFHALQQADLANRRLIAAKSVSKELLYDVLPKYETIPGTADVQREVHDRLVMLLGTLRAGAEDDAELVHLEIMQKLQRGVLALTHEQLQQARTEHEAALVLAERLVEDHPEVPANQRDLGNCLIELGAVDILAGDIALARERLQRALVISEALTTKDPTDARAQHTLFIVLKHLGTVEVKAGNLDLARAHAHRSLAVTDAQAHAEPTSKAAQRDLYISLFIVADFEVQAGDMAAARVLLQRSLAITEALATTEPDNAHAQRDVSVALSRLGELEQRAGDLTTARELFRRSLALAEAKSRADPTSTQAQRDLSVALNQLGEAELQAGHIAVARNLLQRDLSIAEGLARADSTSAAAQRDLASSLDKLADVQIGARNFSAAHTHLKRALVIVEALAKADPTSSEAQSDLLAILDKLADVARKSGNVAAGRARFNPP
jgi:tetratricopeptide (TPR) repeat protein/predicted Ser/Thr protein kinase